MGACCIIPFLSLTWAPFSCDYWLSPFGYVGERHNEVFGRLWRTRILELKGSDIVRQWSKGSKELPIFYRLIKFATRDNESQGSSSGLCPMWSVPQWAIPWPAVWIVLLLPHLNSLVLCSLRVSSPPCHNLQGFNQKNSEGGIQAFGWVGSIQGQEWIAQNTAIRRLPSSEVFKHWGSYTL